MATHQRTKGIILQRRDVGEYDRVITAYTQDFGKLKLVAISARKITSKLRGGLEPLCLSELEFIEGRSRLVVTDAKSYERYGIIRGDLARLQTAFQVLDSVDRLVQGQEADLNIWELLSETLSFLNNSLVIPQEALSQFNPRFFALLGYGGITKNYATR
ncbi:MAG: DNA repair protein RecO [bacterium]|nr:DNA repair protein RecO [bacterium]